MLASLDGGGGDGGGDGDGDGDGARDRGVDSKISPPWRRTTLLWASAVAGQLALTNWGSIASNHHPLGTTTTQDTIRDVASYTYIYT